MGKRIGVVGGGQLGRMLGLAGVAMGYNFRFWDPSRTAPAGAVGELFCANYDDAGAAADFAAGVDVVTYEFENVPAATIEQLQELAVCRPGPLALATSQDRVIEKTFFASNGVATAAWASVSSEAELTAAFRELGPSILKTRTMGYDGKGQHRINNAADCATAWQALGSNSLILEQRINFSRELSIVGARSTAGEIATWPLVENYHTEGILHKTVAPALGVSPELQTAANAIIRNTMEALGYVGVLTVELFECEISLIANEMAPRVHNSGHWSIEGATTSQFENHVRAIAGLPLGKTDPRFASVMINCIGNMPPVSEVVSIGAAHYHDYGKSPRGGRKVGHITVCDEPGPTSTDFAARIALVERLVADARSRVPIV